MQSKANNARIQQKSTATQCSCERCSKLHNESDRLPKLFGCGHTFCLACTKTLMSGPVHEFQCPSCRCTLYKLPAERLLTNHALVTVMRALAANKPKELVRSAKRPAPSDKHKKKRIAGDAHPANVDALTAGRERLERAEAEHAAFYDTANNMHLNAVTKVRNDLDDAAKTVHAYVDTWFKQTEATVDEQADEFNQELETVKQRLAKYRADANAAAVKAAHCPENIAHELDNCLDKLLVDHLYVTLPHTFAAQVDAGTIEYALDKLLGHPSADRFCSVAYSSVCGNESAEE